MRADRRFLLYSISFLVLIAIAHAFTDIEITGARCLGDGRFSFIAQNRYSDPLDLLGTQIVMSHPELGTFPVQGSWNKEAIFQETTSSQAATFTSTTGNLNLSGTYDGAIFFNGCKYPPCKELFELRQCPEFRYSCAVSDLAISQCFVRGDELWVRFSGLNTGQHERLEPMDSLAISIDSSARTTLGAPYVGGMSVARDGEDLYTLKIPRELNEKFYEVRLDVRRCRDVPDPEPAICVMSLKPLVERKLNESMSRENATVTNETVGPTAEPESEDKIRIKRVREDEQEPAPDVEPAPKKERKKFALPEEGSVSPILMTAIFLAWLLGIMVVIVLLFRDRRAH